MEVDPGIAILPAGRDPWMHTKPAVRTAATFLNSKMGECTSCTYSAPSRLQSTGITTAIHLQANPIRTQLPTVEVCRQPNYLQQAPLKSLDQGPSGETLGFGLFGLASALHTPPSQLSYAGQSSAPGSNCELVQGRRSASPETPPLSDLRFCARFCFCGWWLLNHSLLAALYPPRRERCALSGWDVGETTRPGEREAGRRKRMGSTGRDDGIGLGVTDADESETWQGSWNGGRMRYRMNATGL